MRELDAVLLENGGFDLRGRASHTRLGDPDPLEVRDGRVDAGNPLVEGVIAGRRATVVAGPGHRVDDRCRRTVERERAGILAVGGHGHLEMADGEVDALEQRLHRGEHRREVVAVASGVVERPLVELAVDQHVAGEGEVDPGRPGHGGGRGRAGVGRLGRDGGARTVDGSQFDRQQRRRGVRVSRTSATCDQEADDTDDTEGDGERSVPDHVRTVHLVGLGTRVTGCERIAR